MRRPGTEGVALLPEHVETQKSRRRAGPKESGDSSGPALSRLSACLRTRAAAPAQASGGKRAGAVSETISYTASKTVSTLGLDQ